MDRRWRDELDPGLVAGRFELALLLEVSASPKLGLVDRLHDYEETRFHHFLASAAALRPWFAEAARLGLKRMGKGLGKVILNGVKAFMNAQKGGNTHLGSWLLMAPLASAAGSVKKKIFKVEDLRSGVVRVLRSMDWKDAIHIFKAIAFTSPGGLGRVPYLDVRRPETYRELRAEKIGPVEALRPYRDYDVVAHEWVYGYRWVFGDCLRSLRRNIRILDDLNLALAQTFLEILAKHPDTHIVRRAGTSAARRISSMVSEIVDKGGLLTPEGRRAFKELDRRIRRSRRLRPGSTADLLSASLSILLLEGFVP